MCVLLIAVPSWPGRINNDTVAMLQDIDGRTISNWHAPLLQYLWLPFREIGFDLSPVLVAQVVGSFVALFLILETFSFSRTQCSVGAVLLSLHPVTYGLLASVIRDAWFLTFWLLALAASRTHRVSGARRFVAVVVLVLLAYLARQNGIAIAPVLLYAALRPTSWPRVAQWSVVRRGLAAIVATVVIIGAVNLVESLVPVRAERPGAVYMWDLVRFSLRADEMLLPPELNQGDITIDELRGSASPFNLDRLLFIDQSVPYILDDVENAAAREAWVELVQDDPVEYVRMRWELMSRQIGLSGNTRNPFLPERIDNPFGIEPTFPSLARRATDYQLTFNQGTSWWEAGAVHRSWPMLLLLGLAAVLAWRRRRGSDVALDAFWTASGVLATVMFFAPQLHFRFVAPAVVVAAVVSVGMLRPWNDSERPTSDARWERKAAEQQGNDRQPDDSESLDAVTSDGLRAQVQTGERFSEQPVQKELPPEQERDHRRVSHATLASDLPDGQPDGDAQEHDPGHHEESQR